jgi:hypothetical protein
MVRRFTISHSIKMKIHDKRRKKYFWLQKAPIYETNGDDFIVRLKISDESQLRSRAF